MSWYSTGEVEALKLEASGQNRRARRNFFVTKDETATIRFTRPAAESFNYRRVFVKWAQGNKLYTVQDSTLPLVKQAGLQLQASFAWPIIDRRIITLNDRVTGEERSFGPRMMVFADGTKTRKQLLAFEKEQLNLYNEERQEEGLEPVTLEEYNLTSYDVRVSKAQGSPWLFTAKKPKPLSEADLELIEKQNLSLEEELAPLAPIELGAVLGTNKAHEVDEEEETTEYSYSDEEDGTLSFSQ